jgi:hypothetical protein
MDYFDKMAAGRQEPEAPPVADSAGEPLSAAGNVAMESLDEQAAGYLAEPDSSSLSPIPDSLEPALAILDRLCLPDGMTLESLDETLSGADDFASPTRQDDLDGTLLWLEQQLGVPHVVAPPGETVAMQDVDEAPDELTHEAASLDEADVSELTADMPDDPDEALSWLMGLVDEVQEPETGAETERYLTEAAASSSTPRHGARVYDVPAETLDGDQRPEDAKMTPVVARRAAEPSLLAADDLSEMPDDPDEAIAWIERLAAQEQHESESAGKAVEIKTTPVTATEDARESTEPPEQAKQAHERWLDLLQPPPWIRNG